MGASGRATYTVEELAKILGVGRAAVYIALRNGIVPNYRCGRRFIIPKAAVEVWLRNAPAMKAMAPGLTMSPNSRGMPNLNLTEEQIDQLVAYLETLK